jgi:hypothetical protein
MLTLMMLTRNLKFPPESLHLQEIMILGDLNADFGYFDEDKQIEFRDSSKYKWLILAS